MGQCSGKGKQLPFPCGEGGPPLRYGLLIAPLQLFYEMRGIHVLRRSLHVLSGNVLIVQPDIFLHIPLKDEHILLHLADGPPQLFLGKPADVHPVHIDVSLLNIIVSSDQIQYGRLPGSGGSHKGHALARLYDEGHIPQHIILPVVGEPYMGKLDAALDLRQDHRLLILLHQRLLAHDGKNLFGGGNGGLQCGKLLRKLLNGFKKRLNILGEDIERADGNHIAQHIPAAHPQHDHQGNNAQYVYDGPEDGKHHHLPIKSLVQLVILFVKLLKLPLLPAENLNDPHAGNIFREKSVDVRKPGSRYAVCSPCDLAENHRQHGHERQQHKGNHGQLPVQHQHHRRKAYDLHNIAKQPHQNAGIHLVQRLHVIGDSGHQLSHRRQVKIAAAQGLNVGIQILPHRKNNALPRLLQQPGLGNVEHEAQNQYHAVLYSRLHNDIIISLSLEQINGVPDQHGAVQIDGRQRQHQKQTDGHPARIGLHIREQMQQSTALII